MIIGVPKEIKDNEYRVGMTPAGVTALKGAGHCVVVEKVLVLAAELRTRNLFRLEEKLFLDQPMFMVLLT